MHGLPELIGSSTVKGTREGAEVSWDSIAAQASMLLNLGLTFLLQKGLVSSGVLKIDSLTSNNLEIKTSVLTFLFLIPGFFFFRLALIKMG